MTNFRIKENSWIAKIAAKKLKAKSVAIVIGSTIHLCNTSKEDFLSDDAWVKHEVCHVEQFRKYGFFTFIFLYLVESYNKGYYNNKFEVEARNAERVSH